LHTTTFQSFLNALQHITKCFSRGYNKTIKHKTILQSICLHINTNNYGLIKMRVANMDRCCNLQHLLDIGIQYTYYAK